MSLRAIENMIVEELQDKDLWGDIPFSVDDYETIRKRIKDIIENSSYDNYVSKTSDCIDTIGKIEMLMEASDDDRIKRAYKKLLQSAMGKVLETPADNDKCIRVDENIWPEIFWDKSQVALFAQSSIEQYNILKKYNWHCFILDENIDADLVISYLYVKNTNTD